MHNLDFPTPRLSERFFVVPVSSDNRGWTVAGNQVHVQPYILTCTCNIIIYEKKLFMEKSVN